MTHWIHKTNLTAVRACAGWARQIEDARAKSGTHRDLYNPGAKSARASYAVGLVSAVAMGCTAVKLPGSRVDWTIYENNGDGGYDIEWRGWRIDHMNLGHVDLETLAAHPYRRPALIVEHTAKKLKGSDLIILTEPGPDATFNVGLGASINPVVSIIGWIWVSEFLADAKLTKDHPKITSGKLSYIIDPIKPNLRGMADLLRLPPKGVEQVALIP